MARALYVPFRNGILGSHATRVDLDADTLKVVLTDHGGATPNTTTHDFLDDISAGTVATSGALATKTIGTVAAGVFDADNLTFSAVTGNSVESFTLLKDSGAAGTSNLISYWDDATGLPVTPNGGDITITWSASGILTV